MKNTPQNTVGVSLKSRAQAMKKPQIIIKFNEASTKLLQSSINMYVTILELLRSSLKIESFEMDNKKIPKGISYCKINKKKLFKT